jgi:Amt family ammonium transporter
MLVGIFADPAVAVYLNKDGTTAFSTSGWLYGNLDQLWKQAGSAGTVIVYDAVMTFLILKAIGLFVKLRAPDEVLEAGDIAVHDEEAYPAESAVASASEPVAAVASAPVAEKAREPDSS